MNKPKILLWDIETSYYVHSAWIKWTPGMKVIKEKSVICISYKWYGEDEVHTIAISDYPSKFEEDPWNDKYVIKDFLKVMEKADLAIAHNGDKFDMKFFNSRLLKHGLGSFMVKTYDTLKAAKKYFAFHSNRLGDIAKFLGVSKKSRTDMSWWDDILFKSCYKSMEKMIKYCEQDVIVLEDVYNKILPYIQTGHPTFNQMAGKPKNAVACPRTGSTNVVKWGIYHTAGNRYQKYRCKDSGHVFKDTKPIRDDKL